MTCREALEKRGIKILAVHPEGGEFICTGPGSMAAATIAKELERLDFWDYSSPLSAFTLRSPWWEGFDREDARLFLVMGDPEQVV